jgi:hypothetical protein
MNTVKQEFRNEYCETKIQKFKPWNIALEMNTLRHCFRILEMKIMQHSLRDQYREKLICRLIPWNIELLRENQSKS